MQLEKLNIVTPQLGENLLWYTTDCAAYNQWLCLLSEYE